MRACSYTLSRIIQPGIGTKRKSESLDAHYESGAMPVATEASPELLASYQEVLDAIGVFEERDQSSVALEVCRRS